MRYLMLLISICLSHSLVAQLSMDERSFLDTNYLHGWKSASGKVLVPGTYHLPLRYYGSGLVGIADKNYKRGLLDTNGIVIVPPKYGAIGMFNEGMALVINKDQKNFYLDSTGKEIHFDLDFDKSYAVFEGMIQVVKDNRSGFMNKNGKLIIPFRYHDARAFSNGFAAVALDSTTTASGRKIPLWGYIDKSGKEVIPPAYTAVGSSVGEGLFPVSLSDPFSKDPRNITWGYLNSSGKLVIPYKFNHAYSFSDGIALVCIGKTNTSSGKWGFINKNQEFIFPPIACAIIYGSGKEFTETGVAQVIRTNNASTPNNIYFINRWGKKVAHDQKEQFRKSNN